MYLEDFCVNLRHKLSHGSPLIGAWQQIPSPDVTHILCQSSYDWIAVDMEHGLFDFSLLPQITRVCHLFKKAPLLRLAASDPLNASRGLEAGFSGLILPSIRSADHLSSVVANSLWPPSGTRGVGFSIANDFGLNFSSYCDFAQQPFLVAMFENISLVSDLEKICQLKLVDCILVGPYDLSASMGLTGQFDAPEFTSCLSHFKKICTSFGMPFGLHVVPPSVQLLSEAISDGNLFIPFSTDAQLLHSASSSVLSSVYH